MKKTSKYLLILGEIIIIIAFIKISGLAFSLLFNSLSQLF